MNRLVDRMLDEWQKIWEVAKTGRFSHSIFPWVSHGLRIEDAE
jgi:hypothetical protein